MLAERGLGRVYLGLESGCDPLLQLAGKPATAAEAVALTARLKAAGIAVGVIILLGIGGAAYADRHVDESLAALGAMGLGRGDIVYLSPLVADPASAYRQEERRRGIRPLGDAGMDMQQRRIRSGIRNGPRDRPKVALYDIRDFLY
jgi:radical SAM superfamily enzyme YgiQ (UPF0313 family)